MEKPNHLRVIDWITWVSLGLLLLGKGLSFFNVGGPELLDLIHKNIGDLNNLALVVSFMGITFNFIYLKVNKGNVADILKQTSLWSFILSIASKFF